MKAKFPNRLLEFRKLIAFSAYERHYLQHFFNFSNRFLDYLAYRRDLALKAFRFGAIDPGVAPSAPKGLRSGPYSYSTRSSSFFSL